MKFTRDTNRANLWVGLSRYMERFRQLLEICPSVSNDPGSLTHPQLSFLTLTVLLVHGEELSTMDVLPTEVMCACLVAKSFWLIVTPWIIVSQVLCLWDFPDKNTGVGCHLLLQGTFPAQRPNLCLKHLLHWQADSLPLRHWEALFSGSFNIS